ncbi:MAG: MotA/TolQ/ExbB proton channel family protein [Thermoguttaceae bacterium]
MQIEHKTLGRRAWIALGLIVWSGLMLPQWSAAQNAPGKAKAAPAPAAAAPAAEPKDDAAPLPAATQKHAPQESFLHWVIRCSYPIGIVILLLSIYFVSTVGRLFWEMRIEVAAPPQLVLQCEHLLEQRDFKAIYGLTKDDDSFFSRLLTTGISELPNGLAEARDAMERLGDGITAEMEKKISMLAVLGTLGPMIGLLGTLQGMIGSFGIIARTAGSGIDASEVAGKLSEALLLTFEGVALSVPAIYFYALFRNRVVYIASSVMLTTDQFLRHFSHAGRAKASTVAPTPKAPA